MKLGETLNEDDRDVLEIERAKELFDRASDQIGLFMNQHPEADWLSIGFDSLAIYTHGSDFDLPTPEEHAQLEAEHSEPILIIDPKVHFVDGGGFDPDC